MTTDSVDIAYTYAVDGQSYVGSRISFANLYSCNAGSETADYLMRYPAGTQVRSITTGAARPRRCWSPGVGLGIFIPMGIGALLCFIGLGLPALPQRERDAWR